MSPDYVYHYYIDDQEVTREEWSVHLEQDINIEEQSRTWSCRGAIYTDIGESRDVVVNGHEYKSRCDYVYPSAKSLLIDLIQDGSYDDVLEALEKLSESEASAVAQYIERVCKDAEKFILKDIRD